MERTLECSTPTQIHHGKITLQTNNYMETSIKLLQYSRRKGYALLDIVGEIKKELASELLFWDPKQGKRSRGRSEITYIDQLLKDTGLKWIDELKSMMDERYVWRTMVME